MILPSLSPAGARPSTRLTAGCNSSDMDTRPVGKALGCWRVRLAPVSAMVCAGSTTLCALLLMPLVTAAAPKAAWKQDAFWISFWVGPQVDVPELDGRFAEIAEANFTGYLGFNGNSVSPYRPNATRVAAEIELCDKHGLKCVPSLCGEHMGSVDSPCDGLGESSPDFWGFQLLDEVGKFAEMGSWQQQLLAKRPAALNFFNLLGDTPFPTPDAYSAYINSFVQTVKPAVVSMDFYPAFPSDQPAAADATAASTQEVRALTRTGTPHHNSIVLGRL